MSFLTSFGELPKTVQKMMEQRGVKLAPELRSSAALGCFLEQSINESVLTDVSHPQADARSLLKVAKEHLNSRSAEALAVHLYTKELLRLICATAARQYLAEARLR